METGQKDNSVQEYFIQIISFGKVSARLALPYVRQVLEPVEKANVTYVDVGNYGALFVLVPKENRSEITTAIQQLDKGDLAGIVENDFYLPIITTWIGKDALLPMIQELFIVPTDMTVSAIELDNQSVTAIAVSGPKDRESYFKDTIRKQLQALVSNLEGAALLNSESD